MKLIIQIPCFNEEKTLLLVISEIPTKIDGIDEIETLIIDDGSSDKTIEVAKSLGVNHIVEHIGNKGLGVAFKSGIEKALQEQADILVNTDGDNQYPGKYIADLVKPILEKEADIVIGDRQTSKIEHFSIIKKFFQWLGSLLVRTLSGTKVPDSVSGFRAYSRESLLQLNVTSRFSYVIDTIVQAGTKGLKIDFVKIETNAPTRPSRLFKGIFQHIRKSTLDLLRIYAMYHPMRVFFSLGLPFLVLGILGISRFMYFYLQNPLNTGKTQSLVMSGVFLIIAIQFFALGIIGDLIAKNRKLQEDNLYFQKKNFFK